MNLDLLFPLATPEPPERHLGPAEVDDIVDRMNAAPWVDPGQVPMGNRPDLDSGELRLALAVLEDALRCATRHHASILRDQLAAAREAMQWIESDAEDHVFAFVKICQLFDLEPEWIRMIVRRKIEASAGAGAAERGGETGGGLTPRGSAAELPRIERQPAAGISAAA